MHGRVERVLARFKKSAEQARSEQIGLARLEFPSTSVQAQRARGAYLLARLDRRVHAHALQIPPSSSRVTTDDAQVEGQLIHAFKIMADFREDQLVKMRPGQPAIVRIGAHASRAFAARVESIAPASGARLRLLPPEGEPLQSSVLLEFVATPDVPLLPGMKATVAAVARAPEPCPEGDFRSTVRLFGP